MLAGRAGFSAIHLGQLLNYCRYGLPVPPKPFVITFDDGYFCNYSQAFPILRRHGFVATVFLIHNFVRRNAAAPREGRETFMAWSEILEMQAAGWEFHSHGLEHRPMTMLLREELEREIGESRQLLAIRLGRSVEFFCYPWAKFNPSIQEVVRSFGYRGAFGCPPVDASEPVDEFAIGRTEILWGD